MSLGMFANELSLNLAPSIFIGRQWAAQLVMTLRAATSAGVGRALEIPNEFWARPLASGYYWRGWLRDKEVDLELRQFFLSLTTKAPFMKDHPLEILWSETDCYWRGQTALGLKAAYVTDGIAVSLISDWIWDTHRVVCEISEIVDGDVWTRDETIRHASSPSHVELHRQWLRDYIKASVTSGQELWQRSGEFFPSLVFSEEVESQMSRLPRESLTSLGRGLFYLNAYATSWTSGSFISSEVNCETSEESPSTLARYAAERTFRCPDGQERVFNWHAKLGHWRIYFAPELGPGRLLIGYVGCHLRTVTFS